MTQDYIYQKLRKTFWKFLGHSLNIVRSFSSVPVNDSVLYFYLNDKIIPYFLLICIISLSEFKTHALLLCMEVSMEMYGPGINVHIAMQ